MLLDTETFHFKQLKKVKGITAVVAKSGNLQETRCKRSKNGH